MAYEQNPTGYAGVSSYGMPASPQQLRAALIARMQAEGTSSDPVRSPWQGAARLGNALFGSLMAAKYGGDWQSNTAGIVGAMRGQGAPAAPAPAAAGVSSAPPQGGDGAVNPATAAALSGAPMPPVRPPDLGGGAAPAPAPAAPMPADPNANIGANPMQLAMNGPGLPSGLSIPPGFSDASQPGPETAAAPVPAPPVGAGGIYQALLSRGYDPVHAAALVGNMRRESNFDPSANNPGEGANGLIQWRQDRLANLQRFAASRGADWRDPNAQLDFIKWEMGGPESAAGAKFAAASSLPEANAALHSYIRYGDNTEPTRLSYASQVLGGGQGGVEVASNDPSAGLDMLAMNGGGQPAGPQGLPPPPPSGGPNLDELARLASDPYGNPQAQAMAMQYLMPHHMTPVPDPATGRTYLLDELTGQVRGMLPTGLAPKETTDQATGQQVIYDPNTGAVRGRVGGAVSQQEVVDLGVDMMGVHHRGLRDKVTGAITPIDPSTGQPMPARGGAPAGLPPPPPAGGSPPPAGAPMPPAAPPASPAVPGAGTPSPLTDSTIPSDVQGESAIDAYAAAHPEVAPLATTAKAVLRGQQPAPVTGAGQKDPKDIAIMQMVYAANPKFNAAVYEQRKDALKGYNDGTTPNSAGGMINNANTAISHLLRVAEASDALGQHQWGSEPVNWLSQKGSEIFNARGDTAKALNDFRAAKGEFVLEATKFLAGGEGSDSARKSIADALDEDASPEARKQAIQTFASLMRDKLNVLSQRYKSATGGQMEYPVELKQTTAALEKLLGGDAPSGAPAGPMAPGESRTIGGVKIQRVK